MIAEALKVSREGISYFIFNMRVLYHKANRICDSSCLSKGTSQEEGERFIDNLIIIIFEKRVLNHDRQQISPFSYFWVFFNLGSALFNHFSNKISDLILVERQFLIKLAEIVRQKFIK